ncbi:MAG TPA: 3-hydroxyacyl-ACP dehydratase FabZ [Candidatus Avalokitesvara rifleensis]|uniref:3-hydroxyacyl-ACP dehydratase FabZ n=1 Tax=Candidatus Avalokitesvara rifleensis TaxID=3367620 RepID=UPI000B0CE5A7
MIMNFEEVKKLVPQRYPFLFIDKVVELEEGKRVVCLKNVSGNEPFFAGHFPEYAIMPGALTLEALAQAAIILFKKSFKQDNNPGAVFLLAGVKASFVKPVFPGDQLFLEIDVEKVVSNAAMVRGIARVGEDTVAKASFTFATADKTSLG